MTSHFTYYKPSLVIQEDSIMWIDALLNTQAFLEMARDRKV